MGLMLLFGHGHQIRGVGPSLGLKEREDNHLSRVFIQRPLRAIHWPRCLGYGGEQDRRGSRPGGHLVRIVEEAPLARCGSVSCSASVEEGSRLRLGLSHPCSCIFHAPFLAVTVSAMVPVLAPLPGACLAPRTTLAALFKPEPWLQALSTVPMLGTLTQPVHFQ